MAPPTQSGDPTSLFPTRPMITIAESPDVVPFPAPAQTLEASGLTLDLILQLVLKTLHFAGELTGTELAAASASSSPSSPRRSICSRSSSRCKSSAAGSSAAPRTDIESPIADARAPRCSWKAATTSASPRCRSRSIRNT